MEREPVEAERQYVVAGEDPDLPATLGAFSLRAREERTIRDAYLDTPERDLRAAGISLRIRDQDGLRRATYKTRGELDADGTKIRDEIEAPLVGPREEHPAFRAARRYTTGDLVETGVLSNRRSAYHYAGPSGEVEVVLDRLTYPDASEERRLEAEGPPAAVRELALELERRVPGLQPATTSKGQELARRGGG